MTWLWMGLTFSASQGMRYLSAKLMKLPSLAPPLVCLPVSDAYNGLQDPIQPPAHHSQVMNLIKVTDHYLTRGEVACALSHISLWAKCIEDDKPMVILEHDAVMVQPYRQHAVYNSICYLGCHEQTQKGWAVMPTPPHASEGPNYHFICRAHAYAIDPAVAKNLLSHVIKYGIAVPFNILIRADISQFIKWACTLRTHLIRLKPPFLDAPEHGRKTDRNDKLAA